MDEQKIQKAIAIMQADGEPELAVRQYARLYKQALSGSKGYIDENKIKAVESLPQYDNFSAEEKKQYKLAGEKQIANLGVLKLNGGLGTGMGLNSAKTLLPVKNNLSFLDITARQMLHNNTTLILLNSENTDADTKKALAKPEYEKLQMISFVQGRFPKLDRQTMEPVTDYGKDSFNPGGHGAIYTALLTETRKSRDGVVRPLLNSLLADDINWLFISNGDNLGATADPVLFGYMLKNDLPFMMEVAERTPSDTKGGHLVQMCYGGNDRRLTLRESNQLNPEDIDPKTGKHFGENITLHKYFNTNSLWLNLKQLAKLLEENGGVLPLPMILNPKTINISGRPKQDVFQLETAAGSAINIFQGASAVIVPKSRFAPVKKYNDLLLLWSDVYELRSDDVMVVSSAFSGKTLPIIKLDEAYFDTPQKFAERVDVNHPPSLLGCTSLMVRGNVFFGKGVILIGDVLIDNTKDAPLVLKDITITK